MFHVKHFWTLKTIYPWYCKKNKKINIISQKTAQKKAIINRHIIDSAQIIDFIDLKSNTTTDLGSGGGMPGIIIAIMLKNLKKNI